MLPSQVGSACFWQADFECQEKLCQQVMGCTAHGGAGRSATSRGQLACCCPIGGEPGRTWWLIVQRDPPHGSVQPLIHPLHTSCAAPAAGGSSQFAAAAGGIVYYTPDRWASIYYATSGSLNWSSIACSASGKAPSEPGQLACNRQLEQLLFTI